MKGWIQKWWRWLLVGVAVLVAFVLGFVVRRKPEPVVVVPPDVTSGPTEQAKREEQQAAEQHAMVIDQIEQHHQEAIAKLTDQQLEEYQQLRDDPDAVDDFLLRVGRETRGPTP